MVFALQNVRQYARSQSSMGFVLPRFSSHFSAAASIDSIRASIRISEAFNVPGYGIGRPGVLYSRGIHKPD